jgi:galactokinase
VAVPRTDAKINIIALATGEKSEFEIDPDLSPTMGHWSNYPMTVIRRVARNFGSKLQGMDLAFDSDLPPAAGMSSSSAMMISIFLALAKINDLYQREEYTSNINDMESLAGYLGTVENGQNFGTLTGDKGVGTFGGSEDHTAILCSRPNRLSQYSYCPVRFERFLDVPQGYIFAIASCGVVAEKTGEARDKYNRASLLCVAVKNLWNEKTGRNDPHITAALASSDDAVVKMREIIKNGSCDGYTSEELSDRFEQFYAESVEIIPAAGDAMNSGNMEEFGKQVDRSQELTTTQLGNQVPETVFLAKTARQLGAVAASAFGAGFGGSVWSLVAVDKADELLQNWAQRYQQAHPEPAANSRYFLTHPGPSAFELA